MKILLLSDTHGDLLRIDDALACSGKPDLVIHCGDIADDCDYLARVLPADVAFLAVRGNNDWGADRPWHLVCELDGVRFFITHGHKERVKSGDEGLIRAAKLQNCQVALYGHTHRQDDRTENGVRLINPGALSYPGGSYAILQLEKGQATVSFCKLS